MERLSGQVLTITDYSCMRSLLVTRCGKGLQAVSTIWGGPPPVLASLDGENYGGACFRLRLLGASRAGGDHEGTSLFPSSCLGTYCGSNSTWATQLPTRAMNITRKLNLFLVALLAGLCLACQPDPTKARLERVLKASWQSYCRHFIKGDGQVIIPEEGGGTISEAQAYALLRAVWANDPTVFNRVYSFTYEKLSRVRTHGDSLLAWRWGRLPGGSWGVLDANSATDGDLDYALALVLAHRRGWRAPPNLPDYREEARRVQADILAKEVVALPEGDVLLTPGNWHELKPPYLVNPSYFSPAAYRLFAKSPPPAPQRTAEIHEERPFITLPLAGGGWG